MATFKMATSLASDKPIVASASDDPFVASPLGQAHLRHSNYDNQLFTITPATSAGQVKRAIEAHLKDTQRRMEEAGKLGTALVHQQKELTEKLREVEQLQAEAELTPDLRQRLAEIEKDYNEVARESARAFLPKQRIPSNETAQGSPFAPEGKGGRRSVSPSKFESLASPSPSKLNVPNRKLRNQPANRVHDIEFAAEISTSLIAQVRNLQALLAERDEELRDIKVDRSRLELEAEGFQQRMKSLDESENRYKDENWNLETQIHELLAAQKEAADREKKLTQTLNVLQSEKNTTQRELEEVKDNLSKQDEKHAATLKNLEIELGTIRRNAAISESEKSTMQKKVEELTSQNQELARAFSIQRGRALERESGLGGSDEDFRSAGDNNTPEHSPPPSPIKGTPRHSMLESETLKTSLGHAQRTIQTLRTNIHREKTEKLELRRMLQDLRDELEKARSDLTEPKNRRSRKVDSKEFKKPMRLNQLGSARASKTELCVDNDPEWEDQEVSSPQSFAAATPNLRPSAVFPPIAESSSDHFDTANETSDAAFETAHEKGTETEDFQTGVEELSDDDEETETEASPSKGAGRMKRSSMLPINQGANHYSFDSTASTSDDDEEYGVSVPKTPTSQTSRMRLRASRGTLRRQQRQVSEEPNIQSSPASFVVNDSNQGTPQQGGQSLFAELGDLEGSDDDSFVGGAVTPSQRSVRSVGSTRRRGSPPPEVPPLPKGIMIDSGVMTDPVVFASAAGDPEESILSRQSVVLGRRPISTESIVARSDSGAQWLGDELRDGEFSRPLSSISYSDASVQHDIDMEAKLAQFPSPPTSPPKIGAVTTPVLPPPQSLVVSSIQSEHIEPVAEVDTPQTLTMSSIASEQVEPKEEVIDPPQPPPLALSSIVAEHIEPVSEPEVTPPTLTISSLVSEQVEPVSEPEVPPPAPPTLSVSSLVFEHVEPQAEVEPPLPPPPVLGIPPLMVQDLEPRTEPEPPLPTPPTLSIPAILTQDVEPLVGEITQDEQPIAPPIVLSLSSIRTEQVEPVELPVPVETKAIVVEVPVSPVQLTLSPINVNEVEPREEVEEPPSPLTLSYKEALNIEPQQIPESPPPALSLTSINSLGVEPRERPATPPPELSFSIIHSQGIEPIIPAAPLILPPSFSVSTIQSLESEPIEPRTPKRNAFIIPRDTETGRKPELLLSGPEPEPVPDVPASTPAEKQPVPTIDQAAQTSLTSEAIDQILKARAAQAELRRSESLVSMGTPSTVRIHRPREGSFDSVIKSKGKMADVGSDPFETIRRPGSSASGRAALHNAPPLPPNHKEVIEAARSGSSSGGQGTAGLMGPPLFPASAVRNQNPPIRPRTPSATRRPMSPSSLGSLRAGPTPRAVVAKASSTHGTVELHSPSRMTQHSRKSSISSFTSEIDTRFNMQPEGGFDSHGFGPNTDPRMIQAITQTMIGEYLWKYTRKTGREELSGNRHRRYFWVHPYTRTLYWSDRDPSNAGGRSELRAKSVAIEAVRVVNDDNPMPPGLHRKSLIIVSPGRTIKFTCTTGQRHETWFNALSYLLLRTNNEGQSDAEEMAGQLTREDVDEFNPTYGRRAPNGNRVAASLSSYNSRTIRNESPAVDMSMNIPTLTPTPKKQGSQGRPSNGTLGRISGYWKDSKMLSGTFGSLRSRSVSGRDTPSDIYEASEVQDSAEDLREIIERQDRESDRLENVRACCDGKHDVGTLTNSSKRGGGHARGHIHTHGGPSASSTPTRPSMGTTRSRV